MPSFEPKPLVVTCQSCGATAETWDYQQPDRAVECSCCPVAHDHGAAAAACPRDHDGPCARENPDCTVCRPVTITATAHLTLLDITELMEMAAEREWDRQFEDPPSVSDRNAEVAPLWPCLTKPTPVGYLTQSYMPLTIRQQPPYQPGWAPQRPRPRRT